jgi:signal transduction histidine kinase
VLVLIAVMVILADLQYRWSGQVSEAASTRMQTDLQRALMGFRQDLGRELARISMEIQPSEESESKLAAKNYVQRFRHWQRTAARPDLVSNLYLWEQSSPGRGKFLHLHLATGDFEAVSWPANFTSLRDGLQEMSQQLPPELRLRPGELVDNEKRPDAAPRGHWPPRTPSSPWLIDQGIPALISPISKPQRGSSPAIRWLIVELDTSVLQSYILPSLAQRHFGDAGGLVYETAVIGGTREQRRALYSSDTGFTEKDEKRADAELNLFGPPALQAGKSPGVIAAFTAPRMADGEGLSAGRRGMDLFEPIRFYPLHYGRHQRNWEVVAKHRKGSVEAAVAGLRRRNLAVSFGVLLLLAFTMALILLTSQRAQRLANLQMDFVAGVSHELRTPLAVISSAAENIADGVIEDKQQLVRYGQVIKTQAKQLFDLVEQVLRFAAMRQGKQRYQMRPLEVSQAIDAALESTAGVVNAAAGVVQCEIEPNLPPVSADFGVLSQCLQNLITNAVKYGGEKPWVGIRAGASTARAGLHEVEISVADRGMGIAPTELSHIFEPFYRARSVTASQIHGTGLGIPLTKSFVEAMNGQLMVSSEIGKGSVFTIRLRAAQEIPVGTTATGIPVDAKLS